MRPVSRINLPIDVLRTFLMVVDVESFTRAGELLGRSQPAISLQMRRLEEQLGIKLVNVVGRRLEVTEDGRALALYARQILQLNDQAVDRFRTKRPDGVLRVGLPTDYAVAFLQRVMTEYAHGQSEMRLEIVCDLSQRLLDDLRKDQLDIVIAMTSEGLRQYLAREWVERPCWAAARSWKAKPSAPVPLVAHPEGCEYRNRMIQALGTVRREWRIVYCSPGISGLQNAVAAGLGVSALTQRTLTDQMRVLTEKEGFPALADIRVGLYYKHPRQSGQGLMLVNHVMARLDASDEGDFARVRRY
jgi:DNA-binding transcriptional LysR family regulator